MPFISPPDVAKLKEKRNVKGLKGCCRRRMIGANGGMPPKLWGARGDAQAVEALMAAPKDDVSEVCYAAIHTDHYNGVCGVNEDHHVDEDIDLEFPL